MFVNLLLLLLLLLLLTLVCILTRLCPFVIQKSWLRSTMKCGILKTTGTNAFTIKFKTLSISIRELLSRKVTYSCILTKSCPFVN